MQKRAHVILFGNQKGGSGKSTTAVHCAVGLLKLGFKVATIDLDASQQSMTRYLDNRSQAVETIGQWLVQPTHAVIPHSEHDSRKRAQEDVAHRLSEQLEAFRKDFDFIVIDTPGADDFLARAGHTHADTLVTPINDSFVDLDLLIQSGHDDMDNAQPSHYAKLVMEQRKKRFVRDRAGMDWVVLRNRINPIASNNNKRMADTLLSLSKQMGFRLSPGISERVIFRELFLHGLTVLDILDDPAQKMTMSHLAARQEIRELLKALWLTAIDRRLKESAD